MKPVSLLRICCAPDLLDLTPSSETYFVWLLLDSGDIEAADKAASMLSEDDVGLVPYTQVRLGLYLSQGNAEQAIPMLENALVKMEARLSSADTGKNISYWYGATAYQLAECLWSLGDVKAASVTFEKAFTYLHGRLLSSLRYADFLWENHGVEAGRKLYSKLVCDFNRPDVWAAWARKERRLESNAHALSVLNEALTHHPDDPDLLIVLAAYYSSEKQYSKAEVALSSLPDELSEHPIVLTSLGNVYLGQLIYDQASQCYQKALAQVPDLEQALQGLANAEFELGNIDNAENAVRNLIEIAPENWDAKVLFSRICVRQKRDDEAIECLKQIIAIKPDFYPAQYQLANVYLENGVYDKAEHHALIASKLKPDAIELQDLIGLVRLMTGDFKGAHQAFEQSSSSETLDTDVYTSNYLYAQHYYPDFTNKQLYAAHVAYGARFGGQEDDPEHPLKNEPDENRKLRVGYVSPDFRAHAVAFFVTALLSDHDRENFEVFAYSNVIKEDSATTFFKDVVDQWRSVSNMTFAQIRAMILEDQIDILVDLAGHTGSNLLPVFARRVAPVQVSAIGYPNTTGVPAIDYRIIDNVTDPKEENADVYATEKLWRLPDVFLCYTPTSDLPDVSEGPLAFGRPMTFGSFNTAMKMNDKVFDAWAEIMRQVPESNLLLKAKQLSCPRTQAWVHEAMLSRGIASDRIELLGFVPSLGDHLALYERIDLALDTFPYNGTTTTCEAISMGVPVLTVKGVRHSARVGESLIRTVGLDKLFLADNVHEYIEKAVEFAHDRERLSQIRSSLRVKLYNSPLCDREAYVSNMENAFRQMWINWCRGHQAKYSLTPSVFEAGLIAKCEQS